jgi:hypothetical protein
LDEQFLEEEFLSHEQAIGHERVVLHLFQKDNKSLQTYIKV